MKQSRRLEASQIELAQRRHASFLATSACKLCSVAALSEPLPSIHVILPHGARDLRLVDLHLYMTIAMIGV